VFVACPGEPVGPVGPVYPVPPAPPVPPSIVTVPPIIALPCVMKTWAALESVPLNKTVAILFYRYILFYIVIFLGNNVVLEHF
jgi:hypothetical protein